MMRNVIQKTFRGSNNPLNITLKTLLAIFVTEALVMGILHFAPAFPPIVEAFLDALLLSILVTPVLLLLVYRSILQSVNESQTKTTELEEYHNQAESLTAEHGRELRLLEWRLRDKTEKCEVALSELKESEERFKIAANSISDLIYERDVETNRIEWFGDIDSALGFAPDAFPRTLEALISQVHPDDMTELADSMSKQSESAEPLHQEYRIRQKNGSVRRWLDRATAVTDDSGKPIRWIGACTDITDTSNATNLLDHSQV